MVFSGIRLNVILRVALLNLRKLLSTANQPYTQLFTEVDKREDIKAMPMVSCQKGPICHE